MSVERALARLRYTASWQVGTFTAGEAFLQTGMPAALGCLVLDVQLPGMTGVE